MPRVEELNYGQAIEMAEPEPCESCGEPAFLSTSPSGMMVCTHCLPLSREFIDAVDDIASRFKRAVRTLTE